MQQPAVKGDDGRPQLRLVPQPKPHGVLSSRVQLAMIVAGLLVLPFLRGVDNDFWWHLKTGQIIVTSGIPRHDPFSWTRPGAPWTAHEWLCEAMIYVVESLFGYAGNALLFGAIGVGALLLMYKTGRDQGAGTRPLIALSLLAACVLGLFITPRPQIITFAFFALFVHIIARTDPAAPRRAWLLVPLMALWANLHLGFFFGLMVVSIWLLASAWDLVRCKTVDLRQIAAIGAGCIAAACLNPHGPALLWYPLRYLFDAGATKSYVAEWGHPQLFNPFHTPIFLAIAVLGWCVLSRTRPKPFLTLVTVAACVLALDAVRNAPFVALLLPAVGGATFARRWAGARRTADARVRMPWPAAIALPVVIAALVGSVAAAAGGVSVARPSSAGYPASAADYIAANDAGRRLLNSYSAGGYLAWRLYPETRVFIDGRSEFYGDSFLADFLTLTRAEDGWQNLLAGYDPEVVMLPPATPLVKKLRPDPAWRVGYEDSQAVVLERR